MEKQYLKEKDPRGKIILEELIRINKDYFYENNNLNNKEDNLEMLFNSSNYPLTNNSMVVKLDLLKKLRKSKLEIYEYFDIIEAYFNKYYYNMELIKDEEIKINQFLI